MSLWSRIKEFFLGPPEPPPPPPEPPPVRYRELPEAPESPPAREAVEEFDYGGLPEDEQRQFLYEVFGFREQALDYEARSLFWDVMYNNQLDYGIRLEKFDELAAYIWDEYGISFEEIWDWEAFREWYDSVSG